VLADEVADPALDPVLDAALARQRHCGIFVLGRQLDVDCPLGAGLDQLHV
jgi:hypothetical protein